MNIIIINAPPALLNDVNAVLYATLLKQHDVKLIDLSSKLSCGTLVAWYPCKDGCLATCKPVIVTVVQYSTDSASGAGIDWLHPTVYLVPVLIIISRMMDYIDMPRLLSPDTSNQLHWASSKPGMPQ